MKAAIISTVAIYNAVSAEERNLSLYFEKRFCVKVNFYLLLAFPKFLAIPTGCQIKTNKLKNN